MPDCPLNREMRKRRGETTYRINYGNGEVDCKDSSIRGKMNNEQEFKLEIDTGPKTMRGISEAVSKGLRNKVLTARKVEYDQSASERVGTHM